MPRRLYNVHLASIIWDCYPEDNPGVTSYRGVRWAESAESALQGVVNTLELTHGQLVDSYSSEVQQADLGGLDFSDAF